MEVNRNIFITITTLKFPHWLAMVERWSPVKRDIHILLLGTCECYLTWKRAFAAVIKLKLLLWGHHPGLFGWTLNQCQVPL